jgi:hypothetical protein
MPPTKHRSSRSSATSSSTRPGSPKRAWRARPFASVAALHERCVAVVAAATRDEQVALIAAHPDLVGRAALAGTLTPASRRTGRPRGSIALVPEEIETFATLNGALSRALRLSVRDLRAREPESGDPRGNADPRSNARDRDRDGARRDREDRAPATRRYGARVTGYALDWANLLVRWFHFTAGIAWIGASFYFVWLDDNLTRQAEGRGRCERAASTASCGPCTAAASITTRSIPHGPGRRAAQQHLHWFYWEAYSTWLSGMAMLAIVYWAGRRDVL